MDGISWEAFGPVAGASLIMAGMFLRFLHTMLKDHRAALEKQSQDHAERLDEILKDYHQALGESTTAVRQNTAAILRLNGHQPA